MIKIEIKDETGQEFISKKTGNKYYKQVAWAYTVDRDNKPEPYPTRIMLFLNTDERSNPITHPAGDYRLMPSSLRVDQYGGLEIGFINIELIPVKSQAK